MKKVQLPQNLKTRNFEQIRQLARATTKGGKVAKPVLRWERFWAKRLDAQGNLPTARVLLDNFLQHQDLELDAPSVFPWKPLGPAQVPENEFDIRRGKPGLGRVSCIAFGPGVMYAGVATGGLWKSTDEGANWTNVEMNLPLLGISDIAVHPQDPSTIYIGTGDRDNQDAPGFGVMKSTDGGNSFIQLKTNPDNPDLVVSRLLIDPENPSTVIAAGLSGIYRLTGPSDTFNQVVGDAFGQCFGMEYKPGDSSVVYACSRARGVTRTPIIVSRDGGQTWDDAGSGIPTQDVNRVAIAVTPANPNLLYAIFVGDDDGFAGFFRSTDSGVSWSLMSDKPHILSLRDGLTNTGNQGSYDLALAVSPTKPEQIYVGGINVWKSRDSGKNWDRKSVWTRGEPTNRFVHPDQHALAFFPGRADEIWACNDGGIYRSKNAGRTWEDRSNGLQITQVYTIATSRTSKTAVLSSQDNGVIVFDGSGFRQILGGDGFDSAFVEEDQKTILSAVFPIIVMRSTRLGKLTKEVTSIGQAIDGLSPTPRFAVDPVDAETVYLGVRRLFRSTRGGKERTWNKIKSFPDSTDDLTAVRIAPSNPQRLYVCRSNAMFTSADRGDTWTDVTMGLPTFGLTDIAVDPDNPSHVWVVASDSFSGQVFRSFNAGASWEDITGPLPPAAGSLPAFIINTIVRQSGNSNLVYVGTDVGVFLTHDGIAPNWVPYNSDLPTVVVQDLEIHPFTNTLFAATFGRGLWEAPLFIVPSFLIHLFPGALRLVRNGNGSVQVDIRRTPPSFKSTVALTIEGLPVGVTHNFHPQFGDTRTLDIAVGGSVAFGTYNARVIGNTGGIRSEAALTLTIKQFILSLSAPAVTIKGDDNQLKSAVVTVTINRSPGFSDSVQLSVAGLPVGSAQGEGVSAGIDPVSTNGNTSTLRVSAGRFAPEQSLVLTISGSSGNFSDTIQLGVDVLPSSSSAPGGPVQP